MSDEKQATEQKAPIDFSHLGGKKVGHPVPVQTEKEISFEHLGGKCVLEASEPVKTEKPIDFSSIGGKCILRSPLWAETKPAESVEKEDDARE